jgi:MFS family permease
MTRKKFNLKEAVDELAQDMPRADAVILVLGMIAGSQGYTPLSAILGADITGSMKVQEKASSGAIQGMLSAGPLVGVGLIVGGLIGTFEGLSSGDEPTDNATREAWQAKIAMAAIGAIEAYAITRPGTVAGIGEIVKGVGEIIPG